MKIVFRLFAFLVILCALAGTGWGGYWLYRRYAPPGGSGRNMEVRLLARVGPAAPTGTSSGVDGDQGSGAASPAGTSSAPGVTQDNSAATPAATGPDVDVFQPQDLTSYIASGNAPTGWKWLPVANGVEKEVTGSAPASAGNEYVTRTSNGQMFLLVADQPDLTMTHASNVRPWGVDSVRVVNYGSPAVVIHLDQAGGNLMHDFTGRYVGHRIAVVVAGQICEVALIQSPVRSAIEVRLPAGQQAEAESLRDSLMK